MRLAAGLVAAMACTLIAAACTTFSSDDSAPAIDGGGGGGSESGPLPEGAPPPERFDAGAPCPDAACGVVVAVAQAGASEIGIEDSQVVWTIDVAANGYVRTAPRTGGPIRDIVVKEDHPKSLQIYGDDHYFATGNAVRVTNRLVADAGSKPALAGSVGLPVAAARRLGSSLFYGLGNTLFRCTIGGADKGCAVAASDQKDFGVPVAGIETNPAGTAVWMTTKGGIHCVKPPMNAVTTWTVIGVHALAVDALRVFYVRTGDRGIYASSVDSTTIDTTPPLVMAPDPPWAIALDADNVYFTVPDAGTVMKVGKKGGNAIVLASGLPHPTGLAVQGVSVFVVLGDGRIVAIPGSP